MYIHIYIYIYVCVSVYMYVCMHVFTCVRAAALGRFEKGGVLAGLGGGDGLRRGVPHHISAGQNPVHRYIHMAIAIEISIQIEMK